MSWIRRITRRHSWVLLFVLILPALIPYAREGLPGGYDTHTHLQRIGALDILVRQGFLFPRWVPDLMLGYGYPVFNYYAPGTYYIVELFLLLGIPLYYAFISTTVTFLLLAGIGMYFWSLDVFGGQRRTSALIAATAYMYAPYILVDMFVRGNIAELAAMAIIPWILWSYRRLLLSEKSLTYFMPAVVSMSALALLHNLSLLTFPAFFMAYLIVIWIDSGHSRQRAQWLIIALVFSMGLSAFFWLPMIFERVYLTNTGYNIARFEWLSRNAWSWNTLIDQNIHYSYHSLFLELPVPIGAVQLLLGVVGFIVAKDRRHEWTALAIIAVCAVALGTTGALVLWQSSDVLSVIQFPWRLLLIVSPILALFTGAIVHSINSPRIRPYLAPILLLLIVIANYPRLDWMPAYSPRAMSMTASTIAQIDKLKGAIEGGEHLSSVQEFKPKWADINLLLDESTVDDSISPEIVLHQANSFAYDMTASAPEDTLLRLNSFYFPGWRATTDTGLDLHTYPSTNLGLLTVDIPAGQHRIIVSKSETGLERVAGFISLLALLLFVGMLWRFSSARWVAVFPALLFVAVITNHAWTPKTEAVLPVQESFSDSSLRLIGMRFQQTEPAYLYLYPYFQVTEESLDDLQFTWRLVDSSDATVVTYTSVPYYNTKSTEDWAANFLVNDALMLPLPARMQAGAYRLMLSVTSEQAPDFQTDDAPVTVVELPLNATNNIVITGSLLPNVAFEDGALLVGADLRVNRKQIALSDEQPVVVRAGDYLRYELFWSGSNRPLENHIGFIHLTDDDGQALVGLDQLPGPVMNSSAKWDATHTFSDTYLLRVPRGAQSGIYWPRVGLYNAETEEPISVVNSDNEIVGDFFHLPPVKILGEAGE